MIGQVRHTSASVVCQTEVEGNVKVRFMIKCCQVTCCSSTVLSAVVSESGQEGCKVSDWQCLGSWGGGRLVWSPGEEYVCEHQVFTPLPFRFLKVFLRRFAVYNWSIIFAFWKRNHAALLINFSKQYIATAESALFKKKG